MDENEIKVQNWVKELSEPLKEKLKEYLYNDPREEAVKKFYETLEERIKPFVEEGELEEFSTQKHINICVSSTPEELEERKMTVTMTPLTPLGEEIIRRWNDAG